MNDLIQQALVGVSQAVELIRPWQKNLDPRKQLIQKKDYSPVTIADFAVQAWVCRHLTSIDASLSIVAEETSSVLRENPPLLEQVFSLLHTPPAPLTPFATQEEVLNAIDRGCGTPGQDLFWTLDPIDGTKGFLRGEQYAIALALIHRGRVEAAILACPNLDREEQPGQGTLLWAQAGQGCHCLGRTEPVRLDPVPPQPSRMVVSYESSHSDGPLQKALTGELGLSSPPLAMDSQVKYAAIALGLAQTYLRVPHPDCNHYRENIWDHAAGALVVTEAGGRVSDASGRELLFGSGIRLTENWGILAAHPAWHDRVVSALRPRVAGRISAPEALLS